MAQFFDWSKQQVWAPGAWAPGAWLAGAWLDGAWARSPAVVAPPLSPLPLHSRLASEGDSITAGSNGPMWSQFAMIADGGRYFRPNGWNNAVGGTTTAQMLARINAVTALNPKVVTFLGGTNDLAGTSDTPAVIAGRIQQCINTYRGVGARVVVCKVLPRNDATWTGLGTSREADRKTLNGLIGQMAAQDVNVVDLESTFNPTTMTGEGLHPNYAGARVLGEGFESALSPWMASSDVLSLYNDASNMMEAAAMNPELIGTTGVKGGATVTGNIANLWTVETNDTGINIAASKTITPDGVAAQRIVVSGAASAAARVVNFRRTVPYSGAIGDQYEAWVGFSLAAGAQNLRGVYLSNDTGQTMNNTQAGNMTSDALTGVLRCPPNTPLTVADTSNNVQCVMSFSAGAVAADMTFYKPYLRKVPAGQ